MTTPRFNAPPNAPAQTLYPLGAMVMAGFSMLAQPVLAEDSETAPATELAPITIEAEEEGRSRLRPPANRLGKTLQDPHAVPQSITTVTQGLMEDQQVGSLREAMRNVSGLSFNAAEGGRSGDNMSLRGFYTFGDMYLDGIRDTAQYNRETFNLAQIDVLRGAGAMLFGRGQAGGVINQVSKLPMPFDQTQLTLSAGNWNYSEATADINKQLSPDTGLRINAMQRDEGSWRSNPASGASPAVHRKGLGLSLALNQQSHSPIWVNYYNAQNADNPDYGISFDPATRAPGVVLPDDYFWGVDATFDRSATVLTSLLNAHRLTSDSTLRTHLRLAHYDRTYWAKTPRVNTPPDALGGAGSNKTRAGTYDTVTLQSDYSARFRWGGYAHDWLSGAEVLRETGYRRGLQNFGSVAAPDYRPNSEDNNAQASRFNGDSYALYLQDTVEWMPRWKTTLGVRRDWLDARYSSATSPTLQYSETSYRTALSFHPTTERHFYLAWSTAFSPTADLYQLTAVAQPPERSDMLELGAKWLAMDGDLALRAAWYQATKVWERSGDLDSTAAILSKKRRTTGIELEAAGRLTDRWETFAGLSLMDARIVEVAENVDGVTGAITAANPAYAGQRARNAPPYSVSLWNTYQLTGRWKLGGGLLASGPRDAFRSNRATPAPMLNGVYHPNQAPATVRWDAMAAYEQANWTLRINIRNLLDQRDYDAVYENGAFLVPGGRRSVIVTADYRF